jgi:AcrR family transcriptional regulator
MPTKAGAPGPRDERGVLAARILREARVAFATSGWAGTTVRGIARAADVDPALIYHYFGSKEGLLDAATTPPPQFLERVAANWAVPRAELGRHLLQEVMLNWEDDEVGPTLKAILQTAAHEPTTRDKLRKLVEQGLMGPATVGADDPDRLVRSSLIASQLLGFGFMRYVWQIEPIASMSEDEILAAMTPNLQRYIDGEISPRHHVPQRAARSSPPKT